MAQGGNEADLEITKQFSDPLVIGQEAGFRITVTNLGPSDAADVVVGDAFPAELTYVSDTCGVGNANPWVWNIGALAASGAGFVPLSLSCRPMVWVASSCWGFSSSSAW